MFSRLFRRGQLPAPAIAPGYDLLESVTNAANAAANKFVSSNAYKTALNNANSNESKMAGVVGRRAMKEVANKIAYKSRNLTQKVNQAAQNPTPANAKQVVTAANGLQQAVQQVCLDRVQLILPASFPLFNELHSARSIVACSL